MCEHTGVQIYTGTVAVDTSLFISSSFLQEEVLDDFEVTRFEDRNPETTISRMSSVYAGIAWTASTSIS